MGVNISDLRRTEAQARGELLEVTANAVSVDLTRGPSTFGTRSEIRFRCSRPGATTFCEFIGESVQAITLNGRSIDPSYWDGQRIALPELIDDNVLVVEATGTYSRSGEGLHRFVDTDGKVYLYTQFEAYDAHRMYACFDQPDLKTTFELTVTAPAAWEVVSNSPAADVSPADGTAEPVRVHRFAPTARISTYITALVAGHYHRVTDRHGDIELGIFCRQAVAGDLDADELFTVTKQGFDFYHRAFGIPYPFGKYDQLFVPEFNMGAMENAGCVTFLDDYVFRGPVTEDRRERRALTVLHEMAHMWFGDLVTMRWWNDLWLNESFAEFISTLAQSSNTRWTNAWVTFANSEKWKAYRADQLPTTHPVAGDAPDIVTVLTNFDGITYGKGASILKQLVAWVGQEQFLAGLRSYFELYAYGNTTLADLLTCLEKSSGRELAGWAAEWLETTGVNTLRAEVESGPDGTVTAARILQSAPAEHPTLRSHRVAVGLYDRAADGGLERRALVELDVVGATTVFTQLVGQRRPDVLLLNDEDLTYAKIRLDDASATTLREAGIAALRGPLARALAYSMLWDELRDAELPASRYVPLVLEALATEQEIGLLQTQLARLSLAVSTYAAPEHQAALRQRLADFCFEQLRRAEPGSQRQLSLAQAWIAATGPAQALLLQGLLDADPEALDLVPGLRIEAELRWRLLVRLVVLGAAGDAMIDAEAERDATAFGAKRAATARAARPTPEAKAEVWHQVVANDELSNHLRRAVVAGFAPREQAALVAPYLAPYFAALPEIWATRGVEAASTVTEGLFPSEPTPEAIAAADAALADPTLHPAARRMVLEGRATLARALAAQQCDMATG
jgi:aminopeptidase N